MPRKKPVKVEKDWDMALSLVKRLIITQNGQPPKDAQKWKNLLKKDLHRKLYPTFDTDEDWEQLAARACEIDASVVMKFPDLPVSFLFFIFV